MIMNFTKEQIDYVKKALDHIDFLTGSSRNSKTKQIIEELQQENARLKDKIEKTIEHIKELDDNTDDTTCYDIDKYVKEDLLNILKEN